MPSSSPPRIWITIDNGILADLIAREIDLIEELRHRHDLGALNLVTTYFILHTATS